MKQLVRHLGRVDATNSYDIYLNLEDRDVFTSELPKNFSVIPLCFGNRPARLFFQQAVLPVSSVIRGAHVVHSPSFVSPLAQLGRRQVLTVHDMTFFSLPDRHTPLRRSNAFRRLVLRSISAAHSVLVPSVATSDHIAEILPERTRARTRIIPYGIGEEFFVREPDATTREARRLGLPPSYILAVGTIEPRKNLGCLIDAYLKLVKEHSIAEHLVLAGRLGWDYEEILQKLEAPELRGRVHRPGFVLAGDLPWYYAAARLCVYPSQQEGFGFPPLEAMASGVPVISSLSSSLAENLAGAAELVLPGDACGLADAMHQMLINPAKSAQAREAGLARAAEFSWTQTARRTREVYEAVAAE